MEHLRLLQIAFLIWTQVGQRDSDTGIQVGQFSHTTCNDVVFVFRCRKDGWVGPKLLACTCLVGITNNLNIVKRLTFLIFLLIDVTIAEYL